MTNNYDQKLSHLVLHHSYLPHIGSEAKLFDELAYGETINIKSFQLLIIHFDFFKNSYNENMVVSDVSGDI